MDQSESVFLPQEQNRLILQNDIRVLEKRKRDLIEDLERSDRSRRIQHEQHLKAVKELVTQKDGLELAVARLSRQLASLETQIEETSKDSANYSRETVKKAEDLRDKITAEANTLLGSVKVREIELNTLKNSLEDTRQKQEITANNHNTREKELSDRENTVIEREISAEIKTQEAEEKLKKLTPQIIDLERQIGVKTGYSKELDKDIREKQRRAWITTQEANNKIVAVTNRETAVNFRANSLDEREKKLDSREKWLEDREQTAARAFEELRVRGIDGQ